MVWDSNKPKEKVCPRCHKSTCWKCGDLKGSANHSVKNIELKKCDDGGSNYYCKNCK